MDEIIERSPFGNTYGSLNMVRQQDGKLYLRMEDCFDPDYFGPLNDEQVAAFKLLCQVPEA